MTDFSHVGFSIPPAPIISPQIDMLVRKTEITAVTDKMGQSLLCGHVVFGVVDHQGAALRWMHFDCAIAIEYPGHKSDQFRSLRRDAKRQLLRMPEHTNRRAPIPVVWQDEKLLQLPPENRVAALAG